MAGADDGLVALLLDAAPGFTNDLPRRLGVLLKLLEALGMVAAMKHGGDGLPQRRHRHRHRTDPERP